MPRHAFRVARRRRRPLLPRTIAYELVRRGWEVRVSARQAAGHPYELVTSEDEGIRLVGMFNRDHQRAPVPREMDDPPITAGVREGAEVGPRRGPPPQPTTWRGMLDEVGTRGRATHAPRPTTAGSCARAATCSPSRATCAPVRPRRGNMPDADPAATSTACASCARGQPHRDHRVRPSDGAPHARQHGYPRTRSTSCRRSCPPPARFGTRSAATRVPAHIAGPDGPLSMSSSGRSIRSRAYSRLVRATARRRRRRRVQLTADKFARQLADIDRRGVVELAVRHQSPDRHLASVNVSAFPGSKRSGQSSALVGGREPHHARVR